MCQKARTHNNRFKRTAYSRRLPSLRNWEQGRRVPEGPAMVLLRVADKHPEAILDTVRTAV
jgi:DNA-binding transcriptional regulator YiaG